MNRRFYITFLLFFCVSALAAQKVGVVLSGGGARGAAHIGVIKALEENNVPIDYISGTSIGAIVGSLYAMGYSPDEMLELMLSEEFGYWQTGTVKTEPAFFFRKPENTPQFLTFSINLEDSIVLNNLLPGSFVNPIQMNQAFLGLYAQATAKAVWNFDNLFVPFRCTGADIYSKKLITFRNGDLGDAVRVSMTFPFIFKPLWKDGVPLFDGGIYDNFPISVMKEDFKPDFILGSAVRGGGIRPSENPIYQLEPMVMQKTDYDVSEEEGMLIQMRFPDVSLLDFYKAKEVMQVGYDRTIAVIDSIKKRAGREAPLESVRERRKAYKESLPPLIFRNIFISGVTDEQRHYIISQLTHDVNGDFTLEDFRYAYFKMLTYSKIKEIIPSTIYNWDTQTFDLYLSVKVIDELKVSIGGNISSHQANQLFLGLDYQSLGETSADYNANFQMGNSFSGVSVDGRFFFSARLPGYVGVKLTYANKNYSQSQSLFYEDLVPAFIKKRERFLRVRYGAPFLISAKLEAFTGIGMLSDLYYQTPTLTGINFDVSRYYFFNTGFRFEQKTLNYRQYPTEGRHRYLIAQFITGDENFRAGSSNRFVDVRRHEWFQIKGSWLNYAVKKPKFNLGFLGEAVLSNKNLSSNYTASILQSSRFAPTPYSQISFNEAFRADSYLAAGIIPIVKLTDRLHFRIESYGFLPVRATKREVIDTSIFARKGSYFNTFQFMSEAALVFHLPFVSVSLYANSYSFPKNNFNVGLNIGYILFDSGFFD